MKGKKIVITLSILAVLVIGFLVYWFAFRTPSYTVKFETNGGNAISDVKVLENETVNKPADPVKDGYEFLGWLLDDELYDFSTKVTKDITLEAKWDSASKGITLNKYTLTLEKGKFETLKFTVDENVDATELIWKSSNENVVKVDKNGKVTAVGNGSATITITNDDGTISAKCSVTVNVPDDDDDSKDPVKVDSTKVTSVGLNKDSMSLVAGNSEKITVYVNPSTAKNKNVTFSSSDASIATVDANGNVTAVKAGTVTITVKTEEGGYIAKCTVTVTAKPIAVTSVTLTSPSATLNVGATITLTGAVVPSNASNTKLTYKSSDSTIASVNVSGVVTGKKAGTVTITATSANGKKATVTLTINDVYTYSTANDPSSNGKMTKVYIYKNGTDITASAERVLSATTVNLGAYDTGTNAIMIETKNKATIAKVRLNNGQIYNITQR